MATKKTVAGYELIVAELKKNKNAEYADVKAKADKKGLPIYPIMYGRAKAALGLVTSKKRTKKAGKRGPGRPRTAAGPGRPRKKAGRRGRPRAGASSVDAVQDLVGSFERQEQENRALRETLAAIRDVIDEAVGNSSPRLRTRRA